MAAISESSSLNPVNFPCGPSATTLQNIRNGDRKDSLSSDETLSLGLSDEPIFDEINEVQPEEYGYYPKTPERENDLREHERLVIGTLVDPHIAPGFKYRVRPLNSNRPLFKGQPLLLKSIGIGYGKRITFASDSLNHNDNYFWSDSYPDGYGFSIHVIDAGHKFTICDANHLAIGTCEVLEVEEAQVEITEEETINYGGQVTKHVQVELLCNVEWYEFESDNYQPCRVTGVAIAVSQKGSSAQVKGLTGVSVASHRGLTLQPGVDNQVRRVRVNGAISGDVPIAYTITGLEPYEMPVIGTYVDPRIIPGFCYKIRPAHGKRLLFQGQALLLKSIGVGYGKRITMESPYRNRNENYFWSDSYSDGLGFSIQVIFPGMEFVIVDAQSNDPIGRANICKIDGPQIEESHRVGKDGTVCKRVRVDLTCQMNLNPDEDVRTLRVSGIAVVEKPKGQGPARVCSIENIGIASQLYVMYVHRYSVLTFLPVD